MSYLDTLEPIVRDLIAPAALTTDRQAQYPRAALDALGQAGLLGLISAKEVGGMGAGMAQAAQIVQRIAQDCPSTAMVLTMHYCGTAVIERCGPEATRKAIAAGQHTSTLAWSEIGSRSHFWAPVGTATVEGDAVLLNAAKSMVTSAGQANSYVWTSRPMQGEEGLSIWLVDSQLPGLQVAGPFDGLGLRGNASSPVKANDVRVTLADLLGEDGKGAELSNQVVLPIFTMLIASCSIGMMDGALARATAHITRNRFAESGSSLSDLPTIRAYLARAKIRADQARTLRDDTLAALAAGRPDTMLRVLENKASAAEAALEVTDTAMRICGGAAFRKEAGIERLFRDARAASIMAPTSDVLFDHIGTALCDAAAAEQAN
ncbi:acyl-CoA dehydrogenase [Lampropedia puyangensis]|uniref:Acyl-CoA dehydrogenase n=1 Tax=Lampropedia puyangensis TaxID=1330072 RepID=A0A4S8F1B8_9BURK|nr:acyl-CoA dehydrogenase family protein [Lampropedia puyangensis]THU01060.1 acyl-CoA dehydrogenase [Lampropedia puyangensis]